VTGLSYTDEALLTEAKLGIIFASLVAGIVGYLALRFAFPATPRTAEAG